MGQRKMFGNAHAISGLIFLIPFLILDPKYGLSAENAE